MPTLYVPDEKVEVAPRIICDLHKLSKHYPFIEIAKEVCTWTAGNPERAAYPEDGGKISLVGNAAELAVIIMMNQSTFDCVLPSTIAIVEKWKEKHKEGRSYGVDLLNEWFGLPRHLEIKTTIYRTLFMRTKSGDSSKGARQPFIKYWREILPDSDYILARQIEQNRLVFEWTGWCRRDDFLAHYNTPLGCTWVTRLRGPAHLNDHYPVICVDSDYLDKSLLGPASV